MRSNNIYAQVGHQTISTARDEDKAKKIPELRLKKAIKSSNQVLACVKTVFPLTLFTDTVIIDREKLTITKRQFFLTARVTSIRLADILNVTATVGPMVGSLSISNRVQGNMGESLVINKLWRDDALRLKRILQGYVIALQKKIDCSALSNEELAEMLDRIGQDDHSGAL